MNHRELATALAALTPETIETLVSVADSIRSTEANLAALGGKKPRKKRGPNKPKTEVTVETITAPVKKSHHKKAAPASKPLSSALDRLAAKRTGGGTKARKPPVEESDED